MKQREIKFRAWDKRTMKMYQVGSIEFIDKLEGRPGANVFTNEGKMRNDHWIEQEHMELMQYTGLKDKNEKEIYEGDIVRNQDGDLRTVIYWHNSFEMRCINGERGSGSTIWYFTVEIIGNIYEHPELIQPKQ